MIIENQIVKIKWNSKNKKYYENKGYKYTKMKDTIFVHIEDLPNNSTHMVKCICDYCNIEFERKLCRVNMSEVNDNISCDKCRFIKIEETNIIKYGVKNVYQTNKVKEKKKETFSDKYGVDHYSKTDEYKEKFKNTCIKNYGVTSPLKNKDILEKVKQTCLERYGVKNPLQNEEIFEKMKQTNLERYGVEYTWLNEQIKNKAIINANKTMHKNGTAPCSKQQKYLWELLGGELNYPVDRLRLDIAYPKEMIYIEYDGGGHGWWAYSHGNGKKFEYKERRRKKFLQSLDWKIIRIISKNDILPSDEKIKILIQECKDYLLTTKHTWIEINIDENYIKCKEYNKPL